MGNDTIYGWAPGGNANSPSGNDTLNGNAGNDTLFGGMGTVQFTIGSSAADERDRFIYNKDTGALFFDSDGTGALEQMQFAKLATGLAMTNADIS